jgi:diacylglycerol kinase (ATP)
VTAALRAAGLRVDDVSAADADATLLACRQAIADGVEALIVVGGDGMAHLGVNAVAGGTTPLGIVPAGTGNDSAVANGMAKDPVVAAGDLARLLRAGSLRCLDAGHVECADGSTHWFLAVLSVGFDALVNERANGWRWPKGPSRYNLAIARELPVFRPLRYRLTLDDATTETPAMLVSIANGPSFGGGMQIAPSARTDDGLFDVVVLRPVPIPEFVKVFPRVFTGRHVSHPKVSIERAAEVRVEVLSRELIAYADGERLGPAPLFCRAHPGAVRLIAPPRP